MAQERNHTTIGRLVGWSRFFIVVDVIGLFAAFIALMLSSVYATFAVIVQAVSGEVAQKELVAKLVQQADTALLATVLYVIALGLYSLFVDDTIPMPAWLQIRTLGDLKELLASVVIVVIAVVFLGFALTWDGTSELLILGLSCAAVIAALAAFLWVASGERARQEKLTLERERLAIDQCRLVNDRTQKRDTEAPAGDA